MSFFRLSIACAVLVAGNLYVQPAEARNKSATAIPVSVLGEFEHHYQLGIFRTFLSSSNLVDFAPDATGMKGSFLLSPNRCIAIASWESGENLPREWGPRVVCMTNETVDGLALDRWVEKGEKSGVDPTLVIPVEASQQSQPVQTVEPAGVNEPGQNGQQTWVNSLPVSAQVFYQRCGESTFRRAATLAFKQGSLTVVTSIDSTGQPQVEFFGKSGLLDLTVEDWDTILLGCDSGQLLPFPPAQGVSVNFTGTSVPLPLDPDTVFGQFAGLRDLVAAAT